MQKKSKFGIQFAGIIILTVLITAIFSLNSYAAVYNPNKKLTSEQKTFLNQKITHGDNIKKEEYVRVLAILLGKETEAKKYTLKRMNFKDVSKNNSYAHYIAWALGNGYIKSSKEFGLGSNITLKEAEAIALRVIGYKSIADNAVISKADALGLSLGISSADMNSSSGASAKNLILVIYNLSNSQKTSGAEIRNIVNKEAFGIINKFVVYDANGAPRFFMDKEEEIRYTTPPSSTATNVNYTTNAIPTISGITNGGRYGWGVTIYFNNGTGLLNGNKISSGMYISSEGKYNLTVTNSYGTAAVNFVIDRTNPKVSGVYDGYSYNSDRTISFDEGTATLNGLTFGNGGVISAEGYYTLVVRDDLNNSTIISFTIDKTSPNVPFVPTCSVGPQISSQEESAGFDINVCFLPSGAKEGDTLLLVVSDQIYTQTVYRVLTKNDIIVGNYSFRINHGQLGQDGIKLISAKVMDAAGNVGPLSGQLVLELDAE